jgi:hypothetical protein
MPFLALENLTKRPGADTYGLERLLVGRNGDGR